MVVAFHSSIHPRLDREDNQPTDDRLTHVERELTGLRQRLDKLLLFIRQDDMAPLTPAVRVHPKFHREERPDV
jgi:hypothetical protein